MKWSKKTAKKPANNLDIIIILIFFVFISISYAQTFQQTTSFLTIEQLNSFSSSFEFPSVIDILQGYEIKGNDYYPYFNVTVPNLIISSALSLAPIEIPQTINFNSNYTYYVFGDYYKIHSTGMIYKPVFRVKSSAGERQGEITARDNISESEMRFTVLYNLSGVITIGTLTFEDPITTSTEVNVTMDLRLTDGTGNFMGIQNLNGVAADNLTGGAYIVGAGGVFGWYNSTSNVTNDLTGTDVGNFIGATALNGVSFDWRNGGAYVVGSGGIVGYYNRSTNITLNLSTSLHTFNSVAFEPNDGAYFVGGGISNGGQFYYYNKSANVTNNLSDTDSANWFGTNFISDLCYNNYDGTVYIALQGGSGRYGVYNISSNVTSALTATDVGNFIGSNNIRGVACDTIHGGAYFTTTVINTLAYYNVTSNVTTNRSSNFGGAMGATDLAFDPFGYSGVFIAGAAGSSTQLGYYNWSTNTTINFSDTDTGNWIGTTQINGVSFNEKNETAYIAGQSGIFGVYLRRNLSLSTATVADTTAPSGNLTTITNNSVYNSTRITIGSFWNETADIRLYINWTLNQTALGITANTNYTFITNISNGTYLVNSTANDSSGNLGKTTFFLITIANVTGQETAGGNPCTTTLNQNLAITQTCIYTNQIIDMGTGNYTVGSGGMIVIIDSNFTTNRLALNNSGVNLNISCSYIGCKLNISGMAI